MPPQHVVFLRLKRGSEAHSTRLN